MSSFCFGQQALLQGKDPKSKPQAGKSKSTKYETPLSTKQIFVASLLVIIAVIVGSVVLPRINGTTQGNLRTITIK